MPRIMDGSRRSRLMCSGCGRPRPALWTGLVIFGWMAVFLLACLMFSWPMPLGIRDESSASLLYDLRGEVRVPEAESEVIVVEEVLEGAQSTIDRPPDKYEGDGESRQDDIVERTASSEQTSVPDVVEGQGHNGGGTSLSDALPAVRDSSRAVEDGVEFAEVAAAHGVTQENYSPSVKAIRKPFVQSREKWRKRGHGFSVKATGEPKSGTTWMGTQVTQLAVELCESDNNPWCEMGGLVITPNIPADRYEFELIDKGGVEGHSPGLYMHFKGDYKHVIPGMDQDAELPACTNGGRIRTNFFQELPPCKLEQFLTRSKLKGCLWDASPECQPGVVPMDPSIMRNVVIVRDPRNVAMSERRMRIKVYKDQWVMQASVDDFVRTRFETLVSWIHQRWEWHHSDAMKNASHVVLYEDLQASHKALIDIASFLGLECTTEQAMRVWRANHRMEKPTGDYTTQGLHQETLEFMNATMAKLLPVPLVHRYGLVPTDV